MDKEKILFGIIGLLIGVIVGYIGTNYLNRTYSPVRETSGNLPPDHPQQEPKGEASAGSSSNPATGPQADVMAVIQKARNEPSNFDAQMQAASLFGQINRHDKALEFYERAYKLKPKDFELLVLLGNTTFDLERYEEAEKWYQAALNIKPNDPTVRMDLGLTYYLRQPRNLDQAITEYRKALNVDPRHEKALQNLTAALIEKGDQASARESLKRLEQVNPTNQALTQLRARLTK
jgi:tetratricopeptide (TPR) repeat protein